jgi:hypothetical protein
VYFSGSQFFGYADFKEAIFQERAVFSDARFKGGAYFDKAHFQEIVFLSRAKFEGKDAYFNNSEFYGKTYFSAHFNGETKFNYVLFEGKEKVIFDIENLSNVSFMNTDITGVRFSDEARWREKKVEHDKVKIIDERLLEEKIKEKEHIQEADEEQEPESEPESALQEDEEKDGDTSKDFTLGSIKAVYRNLRENYEYRMRYDEAGQFFIREMELKRKYREVVSSNDDGFGVKVKQNNWFRRNLLSLTGW